MGGNKEYEFTTAEQPMLTTVEPSVDPRVVLFEVPAQIGKWAGAAAGVLSFLAITWLAIRNGYNWQVILFLPPIIGIVVGLLLFLGIYSISQSVYLGRIRVEKPRSNILDSKPAEAIKHSWTLTWDRGGVWNMELPEEITLQEWVVLCKKFLINRTAESDHPHAVDKMKIARDVLMTHGLAVWKPGGRNQGWQLNSAGRSYCKRLSSEYDRPYPTDEV